MPGRPISSTTASGDCCARLIQRLGAIVGQRDLVAGARQETGQTLGSVDVIVHDQHASSGHALPVVTAFFPLAESRDGSGRKTHREGAAAVRAIALRLDAPAVQFDEFLHNGQANAQAAFTPRDRALALREKLEHLRHPVGRNADAIVAHGDAYLSVGNDAQTTRSVRPPECILRRWSGG